MTSTSSATRVYLEVGKQRVFACALDWPGWCRSAKDEARSIEALAAAAPRYANVATNAGIAFPAGGGALEIVEHLPGNATTDFGAPDRIATNDAEPLAPDEAERIASLLVASWTVFDLVAAGAPAALRKGPRGGGRDRDAVVAHVLGSEASYARSVGLRLRQPALGDTEAIQAGRDVLVGAFRGASDALRWKDARWPPRYAARRIAWHVLDHAWETEDRSHPGPI